MCRSPRMTFLGTPRLNTYRNTANPRTPNKKYLSLNNPLTGFCIESKFTTQLITPISTNSNSAQLLAGNASNPSCRTAQKRHAAPGTNKKMWYPAQIDTEVKTPNNTLATATKTEYGRKFFKSSCLNYRLFFGRRGNCVHKG